jgi:hypothetical protein
MVMMTTAMMMRPHVPGFGHDTGVDDMVCNDWSIYY